MNEILENGIKIYQFPDSEGDEEEAAANKKLRVCTVCWSDQSFNCPDSSLTVLFAPIQDAIPFAVVGSNTVVEVSGKKVRGRLYPWGVAEVDNLSHCDFTTLRNMLVR